MLIWIPISSPGCIFGHESKCSFSYFSKHIRWNWNIITNIKILFSSIIFCNVGPFSPSGLECFFLPAWEPRKKMLFCFDSYDLFAFIKLLSLHIFHLHSVRFVWCWSGREEHLSYWTNENFQLPCFSLHSNWVTDDLICTHTNDEYNHIANICIYIWTFV